jgi:hypothetical protein
MAEPVQRRISQVIDVGTTGGDWMFKQNDMVFGPMPARLLIEKMYLGEVGGDTLIAPSDHDGEFSPLREVSFFTVHLAKAEARLRVKRDTDEFNTLEQRGRTRRTTVIVGLIAGALIVAGGLGYYLVVERHRMLQKEIDEIPITGNAPEVASADPSGGDEVEVPVPGAPPGTTRRVHRGGGSGGAGSPGASNSHGSDGLADINYDKNTIISAEVRQKPALIPCIKQELQRMPNFRGDIKFTVAVGNDGHVAKLWMEEADLKDGPLQACFQQKMASWKFATYEGERATLTDSFHVGQ